MRSRTKTSGALIAICVCLASAAFGGISLVVSAPLRAPPPPRVEARGAAPSKDAVWIDGRWMWRNGNYLWTSGHWEQPKNGFHRWQQGRWAQRGSAWYWISGKWL